MEIYYNILTGVITGILTMILIELGLILKGVIKNRQGREVLKKMIYYNFFH